MWGSGYMELRERIQLLTFSSVFTVVDMSK